MFKPFCAFLFSFYLFFSLNTSTDLKIGTDCFIFTQSLVILGVPTCGAAQPIHSHTVPITQQAAVLTADEMFSLTASGGSERHRHLPEGDTPLQELCWLPMHLPRPGGAWAELTSARTVVHLVWTQLAAGEGSLLRMVSGWGFGWRWAWECRKEGRREAALGW